MGTLKAILIFIFASSVVLAADSSHFDEQIKNVLSDPYRKTFGFNSEEVGKLLQTPDGALVPLLREDGQVDISMYLGVRATPSGEKNFVFRTMETISAAEYESRAEQGAYQDGSAFGNSSAVANNHLGSTQTGANPPSPESGGRFGSDSFTGAAQAGAQAALLTGFVRGVLIPPGDQREFKRLQAELDAAAIRTARQEAALKAEISAYEAKLADGIGEFMERAVEFEPLNAPVEPSQESAFRQSSVGSKVSSTRLKMQGFSPENKFSADVKEISLLAADAAEESFYQGELNDAEALAETAELFADVALGFIPLTAVLKDGYEAITGLHALSQRPLGGLERSISAVSFAAGLATMGIASSAVNGLKIAGRIIAKMDTASSAMFEGARQFGNFSQELGLRTVQGWQDLAQFTRRTLGNELGSVGSLAAVRNKVHPGSWVKSYKLHRIQDANLLNARAIAKDPKIRPPYKPGSTVFDVVLKEDSKFVRLHGAGNQSGKWVIRVESVDKGLSPADLRLKYSLPFTPDAISDVTVRQGTMMRRSLVNSNFGGGTGAVQYEILDPLDWGLVKFGPPRALSR